MRSIYRPPKVRSEFEQTADLEFERSAIYFSQFESASLAIAMAGRSIKAMANLVNIEISLMKVVRKLRAISATGAGSLTKVSIQHHLQFIRQLLILVALLLVIKHRMNHTHK